MIFLISTPIIASGTKPTGVITEYLPPISSGITNVSYPSLSANAFNVPRALSVVAMIRSLHSSLPYFFSMNSRNTRKASAVSVVVPDLEITFITTLLSWMCFNTCAIYVDENVFPTKITSVLFPEYKP